MPDSRETKLAQVLVRYSTAVKKGDLVRIEAAPLSESLVAEIFREVLQAGGHATVRMVPDTCQEIFLKLARDAQLKYVNPLALAEVKTIDAAITVWAPSNTRCLTQVNPARQAMASRARKPIFDIFIKRTSLKGKRGLRWVGTQYPCQACAQEAEMSLAEYQHFVYTAGLLHLPNPPAAWKKISVRQKRLCDRLDHGRQLRFRTPRGTDLRVGIAGRKWINCDGKCNFPDGEVFTGPIETATEGQVRFDFPAVYMGREVLDVWLKFKAGRVADCSASKGQDFLEKMLDQDGGGRVLGEIALGTNYAIRRFTRNTLFDEKIGGTFHAALGMAFPESGGRNKSAMHWDMVCDLRRGGVVELDGKVISRDGRLLFAGWPAPVKG